MTTSTLATFATGATVSTAILLAGLSATSAQDAGTLQGYTIIPEQREIAAVQPPPSDMTVSAWVDQEDNTYAIGEQLTLSVLASEDAYLTIINIGTDGQTTVIFPNQFQTNSFVPADQVVTVPAADADFILRMSGPPGTDLIRVIASDTPFPILEGVDLHSIGPVASVRGGTASMVQAMTTAFTIDVEATSTEASPRWAVYDKVVEVVAVPDVTVPFDLSIAPDQPVYRLGEAISFQVVSSTTCQLSIAVTNSGGVSRQVFPFLPDQDPTIPANVAVVVPGGVDDIEFRAVEPIGTDTATAVCTQGAAPARSTTPMSLDGGGDTQPLGIAIVRTTPSPTTAIARTHYQVVR